MAPRLAGLPVALAVQSRVDLAQQRLGSCFHDGCNLAKLTMLVIVDLCVVPIGVGVHLAPTIAACEKVPTDAELKLQLHSDGERGKMRGGVRRDRGLPSGGAHHGLPRVYNTVTINTRTDIDQTLEDKVSSMQALL